MTKPIIQIGDERREMTDVEFASYQQLQRDVTEEQARLDAETQVSADAKASARSKLAALGLTEAEVSALLGA